MKFPPRSLWHMLSQTATFISFITIAGALVCACTTIRTVSGPVDSKVRGHVHGLFYHLPQGALRIKGDYADTKQPEGDFIITITSSITPDPRTRYYLEAGTNVIYDDDFKLHVNGRGLLETVNVSAEDKTAAIIGDVAGIAASVLKFSRGMSPSDHARAKAMEKPPLRLPFDYTFLPDEADTIKRLLHDKGFDLEVFASVPVGATAGDFAFRSEDGGEAGKRVATRDVEKAPGVVFRPLSPYRIVVTDTPYANQLGRSAAIIRAGATVMIPDNKKKLLLRLGRTPFIKRTDNLVFVDGVLTKFEGTRPSPIVGVLQIPKNILTAIVPLPLEIRQTQINNINAERELEELNKPSPTPTP